MSTILVIEDSQDNFDLIEDALGDEHGLVHATTGQEGLAQARAHRPDLILLDMGLPVMDGWEVAQRLKADPETRAIPVVALTAHAMSGDREKCMEMGCDDYMAKPININELVAMIKRHLCQAPASSGES
ncbi:MAG: response regulator [Planctomycetes bacterium]|nr:response regulator [Planctomycetota bacterium]